MRKFPPLPISRCSKILLILAVVMGCSTGNPDKDQVLKFEPARSEEPDSPDPLSFLDNYEGKYSREQLLNLCSAIPSLREQAVTRIAQRLGILYEEGISLELRDWEKTDENTAYRVFPKIVDGKMQWHISLIAEHLISGTQNLQFIFSRAFVEAVIAQKTHLYPSLPPAWFKDGAIYYAIGDDELVAQKFMLCLLEDPRGLSEIIEGIGSESSPFPEMEGYFAFRYFKDVYGEAALKKWIVAVMREGKDWEQGLREVHTDFPSFQTNARLYTIEYLKNHYWPAIVAYRNALRLYLDEEYLKAIPQMKELSFQFPGSFMAGGLAFWIGMCYYRLERYLSAAECFEECFQKYGHLCSHLPVASYRYAMCSYHQKEIDRAIEQLSDFIRDFPYHELCGSAHFFLAECFRERTQLARSQIWYLKFIEQFPGHPRRAEALLKAGDIGRQLGWYAQAKKYYKMAMSYSLPADGIEHSANAIREIEEIEAGVTPPFLANRLETMVEEFKETDVARQQAIIREIADIGSLALPWLNRIAEICPQSLVDDLLNGLCEIASPASTPIFADMLRKYPSFSREVLGGLITIGIPASFLKDIASQVMANMPDDGREEVLRGLESVLWGTSPEMREQFPDMLRKLNGTAEEQLEILEILTLEAGQEQVPVLLRLVADGKEKRMRMEALQNLLIWHDPRSAPLLRELLSENDRDFHALAIEGLAALGEYPLPELKEMLSGPLNVRLAAVESLAAAPTPDHRRLLIRAMEDPNLEIRNRAREKLLSLPHSEVLPLTLEAFLEEGHTVYFYMGMVEIIERITLKRVPYTPDMNLAQRKKIAESLQ